MNASNNNDLGLRGTTLLLHRERKPGRVTLFTVARVGWVKEKGRGILGQHGGDNDADCVQGEAVQGQYEGNHCFIGRRAGFQDLCTAGLFGWLFWGKRNSGRGRFMPDHARLTLHAVGRADSGIDADPWSGKPGPGRAGE